MSSNWVTRGGASVTTVKSLALSSLVRLIHCFLFFLITTKKKKKKLDTEAISAIGKHYMEGICWVMRYYYQGCPSWKWFYPHHFAPFAEDFKGVSKMLIDFELGTPFNPLEQLMGVFPAASGAKKKSLICLYAVYLGHLVPSPFRKLMVDTESPIYDFYPTDFAIDMNGKKMAWQGVALLPFVEEKRLLDAMKQVYPLVPEDELALNVRGPDRLFVGEQHPLYESLCSLYGLVRFLQP